LQPVQSFQEGDEDDEVYEPVTPAPLRHAKPLGAIIPFIDEEPKSSPSTSSKINSSGPSKGHEVGPRQEEDIFFIDPRAKVTFQPPPKSPEPAPGLPPGIVDDENEEGWNDDGQDDYEQDEEGMDSCEVYEEGQFVQDEEVEYPPRWAPALTPITERTYEHTGNSKMWSTPVSVRDKSVMDTPFEASRAFQEAERLAAELRADRSHEDGSSHRDGHSVSHSSWEDVGQKEEAAPIVVDPYIRKSIAQLVDRLAVPSNHRDLRPKACGQLEKLQKFVNPKGKSTSAMPRRESANCYSLILGGHEYEVHRKLGEGGFGAVFLANDVALLDEEHDESGAESALVAIKVVKPAVVWESVVLDRIHHKVHGNIRPSLITPRCLYIYQDESYHILNYSNHGTLLEAVNKAGDLHVGSGIGGVASTIPGIDEMLAMFFTVELLRTIEGLHSAGFIHGDLKIDNCMVRLEESASWSPQYDPSGANGWSAKGIVLIDFGRAIDTSLYSRGTSFVTDWKMDKRDCLEMREGRVWTYETDYYGLAGIIFCMLFGKYMELPVVKDGIQKLPATLKRYWKTALWERLFSALLNPNGFGKPLPIVEELGDVRREMESWLVDNGNRTTRPSTLRALVKRLEALSV
jgi:checkpoint serine/threonine-protein kinase